MLSQTLIKLFERDLNRLKDEINSYQNEEKLWLTEGKVKNSAGNLTLHLLGNMNHFIGAVLGNSGYVRTREKEFSDKDIPKAELNSQIEELIETVKNTIAKLTQEDYDKIYPINVFGEEMTTEFFLVHLAGHLNYHLGQINYHRRLLDK